MTELWIEGQRADISAEFSALITLTLDDLKDFAARNTSFSKTIILPGSARNNKLFGNIFDVTNANPYNEGQSNINVNFNAAKRARCIIVQDSIQSFKGDIRLLEIVLDNGSIEYEVAVFGELYGLIAAIGRNRLEDLDFSAYDHTYSWANILASWDDYNAGQGYYYPLIDYGGYSTNKDNWAVGTFRAALFVREYLTKIFDAAGYSYDFPLLDTERFKRLIIPYNRKILTSLGTNALTAGINADQVVIDEFSGNAFVSFDTVNSSFFTPSGGNTAFTYTPAGSAAITINFRLIGSYISAGYSSIDVTFYKNATVLFTQSLPANATIVGVTIDQIINTTINQNDVLSFEVVANGIPATGDNFTIDSMVFDVLFAISQQVPITIGGSVLANDMIPKNILQRDFLSSIVKLFNLYIYEDADQDRHVRIAPYVDFYTDPGQVNWSQKVDRNSPIKITPLSFLTARFYNFKFKDDSDYYNDLYKKRYNESYGEYIFDSAFDFEDSRETVELIFSPSVLVGYSGEDKIMTSILKIENGIETQTDSNIRLLQALKVSGVTSWAVTGVASGLTTYPYAGHYDDPDAPANDIQFGVPRELFFNLTSGAVNVQQFNLYWSSYMAEITDKDSKLLKCKMRLTVADIATLDFSKLIWIDGALWRLVKISDYNVSTPDLCDVELLKVIEISY
jgi:hypothetical protein